MRRVLDGLLWRLFDVLEHVGVHVLPVNYYSPIPDMRELRKHRHLFDVEHPMPGVDMRIEAQLRFLEDVVKPWEGQYLRAGGGEFGTRAREMPSFAPINALALYAVIRHFRPARMIEVGSGTSTVVAAAAFRDNRHDRAPGRLVAIDPHPSERLRGGRDGLAELVQKRVQDVPIDMFLELGENDVLFIDSTHTVKIFGDVTYLYLTVLPQLNSGVIVHIHDIFFPLDYLPHHFFRKGFKQIWQEQYLLHAFLMFNREYTVLLSNSFVHFKSMGRLRALFPWYHVDRWPSSFWMRRISSSSAGSL